MTVEEWLGKDNRLGIDIWNKKYRYEDETFEEWLDRISGKDGAIRKDIVNKRFLFGGRILANRGLADKGRKICYSNCFVTEPPEDNIESIFDCAKRLARTYSYGGGCGVDISKLAPRGAKIHNAAKTTSGAVSFMDLYSLVTSLIGMNGRRGALMISIDCSHPDLEEFIGVKADLGKVTSANISVRITDEFMQAVKDDTDYTLSFTREATGEVIEKTVRAKELFRKLAEMNWRTGEPGMLFWDRISDCNMLSGYDDFEFAGTNPCFTGDMKLLTDKGYQTFKDLEGKTFTIRSANGGTAVGKVWSNGVKDIVKVIFADGRTITCTPSHVFMLNDGTECQAKDLKRKRVMPYIPEEQDLDPTFIKLGFIQGDGNLHSIATSKTRNSLVVNLGKKDNDMREAFIQDAFQEGKNGRSIILHGYNDLIRSIGMSLETLPNRVFPSTYSDWTLRQKQSFLQGCYSANGSIIKGSRIAYKTTCADFAAQLVDTLKADFGISAYVTTNKPSRIAFSNGTYLCRESYDVNIGQFWDIVSFAENINFVHNYKRLELSNLLKARAPYVYNVQDCGREKVYDFTEPIIHWGVVNGVIVHNCGEEPLPAGGSCLLGAINLAKFVTADSCDPDDYRFNYAAFEETVAHAVKALNDVLDEGMPLLPLKEQRESVRDWRQIGLGIMGLADMLIQLEIPYGSPAALDICEKIGSAMINQAVRTSVSLAEEHGAFLKFNSASFAQSAFAQRVLNFYLYNKAINLGMRNSQLLTIAPTGTISTMIGVSGGIEPIFANYYERRTQSLYGEDVSYKVYTPIVKAYIQANGITDDKDLPEWFVTARDIAVEDRIKMQAVWQKHIDASISSTVNLPESATVKDVEELYMKAWEAGLKGITVFRENCERSGILTTQNSAENPDKSTQIPAEKCEVQYTVEDYFPRGYIEPVPDKLTYRKYRLQTGCGRLYLFVGIDEDDGRIYDCFTNTDGVGGCVVNTQANSRLMSACIRGGVPVEYVIEQLEKAGTCPSYQYARGKGRELAKGKSCPSAIANVLKGILQEFKELDEDCEEAVSVSDDNEDSANMSATEQQICPECGAAGVVHENGCNICKLCGWSKCG